MPDSARRYTAKICGVWLLWQLCSGGFYPVSTDGYKTAKSF